LITGDCPYCDAPIINEMPAKTPAYSRQTCESCKNVYWLCHSRIDSWAMKEEDFLEKYEVDTAAGTIKERAPKPEIPITVEMLFKVIHENRDKIATACGLPSEFLNLTWLKDPAKRAKAHGAIIPEKLMEHARKLWIQIAPDKPADGVEVAIIASAWRELWQDTTNIINHCLNDHYDKAEYQELEHQVEELKKDVTELTAGKRGDTNGYNLAFERRKKIEDLEGKIAGVRYHGCLTGDCPHDDANDCLKSLSKDVEDICKEETH
jgi:hypothetical protein